MSQEFYYQVESILFGPMTGVELRKKAVEGYVEPDTLVRVGVDGEWVAATCLENLFDESGRPIPEDDGLTDSERVPMGCIWILCCVLITVIMFSCIALNDADFLNIPAGK